MITFTLDTNCLIDIEDERPSAAHIRRLLIAHSKTIAHVAMVVSSASENRPGENGPRLPRHFAEFEERRHAAGLAHLDILPTITRLDISFIDFGLITDEGAILRENQIFKVLASGSDPSWASTARQKSVDPRDVSSRDFLRWRNKMLDAQAFWAHEHANRDVFVSSDRRFKNLVKSPDFPTARVHTPAEAAALLGSD